MKIEWDIHHVIDEPASFHTHGLEQFGSLEIEIALPLYPHEGAMFCNNLGAAIRDGLKVEDGQMVEGLFNLPVFFFKTMPLHGDKEVYRVVFPDEKGYFPWDMNGETRCDDHYIEQISFEKDKTFWLEVSDCETVERHLSVGSRMFECFEKRNNTYVCPIMHYIGGDKDGLIRLPPYMHEPNVVRKCQEDMLHWAGVRPDGYRIVCRDFDPTDPMNKSFCEWKEKYW